MGFGKRGRWEHTCTKCGERNFIVQVDLLESDKARLSRRVLDLHEDKKELQDALQELPLQHKDGCDTQMCSIACARCTCGAKEERERLLGVK